jgi:hypothetical protein
MDVSSSKNIKSSLSIFIGDTIFDFGPNHHLETIHVIVHNVFENWLECLFVYQEKVNFVLGADLDTDIALYKINKASYR